MYDLLRDPATSTRLWFRANTDTLSIDLLIGEDGARFEDLSEVDADPPDPPDWHVEPDEARGGDYGATLYEEPAPEAYRDATGDEPRDGEDEDGLTPDEREAYAADHAAWTRYDEAAREWIADREERSPVPMWSTLWGISDGADVRRAVLATGLRLYTHPHVGGYVMGADSAGHSFYGAYWIPLRARLAFSDRQYADPERLCALRAMLRAEIAREGDSWRLEAVLAEVGFADAEPADPAAQVTP